MQAKLYEDYEWNMRPLKQGKNVRFSHKLTFSQLIKRYGFEVKDSFLQYLLHLKNKHHRQ